MKHSADSSQAQNAMLERLAHKHACRHSAYEMCDCYPVDILAALRELLLAVQRTSAEAIRMHDCGKTSCHEEDAEIVLAQTFADLFQEEA